MDENELLTDMHILSVSLEQLREMTGPELGLPGGVERYHQLLEDAYAAYGRLETQVDEWGQQLEYDHQRLDKEVKQYGSSVAEPDASADVIGGNQGDRRLSVIGGLAHDESVK